MVLIHYKKTDHNQFLMETKNTVMIDELIVQLVQMNNIRIEIDLFACALQDLATHGPLKPEQIRGLNSPDLIENALVISSEEKKRWGLKQQIKQGQRYNEDPTHFRIGIILNQNITQMMIQTSNKAKKLISSKNVDSKKLMSLKELREVIQQMKAALIIAYPNYEGLGEWQTARQLAQKKYDLQQRSTNTIDYLELKEAQLWWAGKQLLRGKQLNFYTGKNEKTKIIVKLTKQGTGAPMREPTVTQQQKTKMMSIWHKKQEQMKKLEQNNEDDFLNSPWANPKNLKNYLVGGGNQIKWKGGK